VIVVAGFNSAIDRRIDIDAFVVNAVNRATTAVAEPGGKGVHVAKTIASLGAEVHLVGLVDDTHQAWFETTLRTRGVIFHGVTVPRIRTCFAIREHDGRITELLEPGPTIDETTVKTLLATFRGLVAYADIAVLSGSLPPGCPDDTYAQLIVDARARGTRCRLDTSGDGLRAAIAAQPFLVKPNRDEAEMLCAASMTDANDVIAVLRKLARSGVTMPVVSMGAQGAYALVDDAVVHVAPPTVHAINPVGSGDCLIGGMAFAFARGDDCGSALLLGVACGAANAATHGTGCLSAMDVASLVSRARLVEIRNTLNPEMRR
jgi:1-phosphofructokinase family hexose kinase